MNSNGDKSIDVRNCLDRRFQIDGDRYVWKSTVGMFMVSVIPWRTSTETDCVRVVVYDCLTDLEVEDWSHSVRCTDNWRERLQELVGKAMIRAQHRPLCPSCNTQGSERVLLLVRTSVKNRTQFFGCANYHTSNCRLTWSISRAFELGTRAFTERSQNGEGQSASAAPKSGFD
jgi:hypothetical protein